MWKDNTIEVIDCLDGLSAMPDECVQTCVSSPPYWRLRDYGVKGQIGMENTPTEYIDRLMTVFSEVKRVLKSDGTLWLILGDTYNAYKGEAGNRSKAGRTRKHPLLDASLKNKDLIGIPWRVAFALQALGFYLRQDIIWCKPNPMPESVRDRCTKAHEYIFLLSKSEQYYFDHDAIKVPLQESSLRRLSQDISNQEGSSRVPGKTNGKMRAVVGGRKVNRMQEGGDQTFPQFATRNANGKAWETSDGLCNRRSVWIIGSQPFKEKHFATYPERLVVDCIKAGSRPEDIVLDPFMGAGTTAVVAIKLNRKFIGFELNPDYVGIAARRLAKTSAEYYKGP